MQDISKYSDLYIIEQQRDAITERIKDCVSQLWQNVRIEETDGKFRPYFDETVANVAAETEALNDRIEQMNQDTNTFKDILGDCRSIEEMARARMSAQRAIASAADTTKRAQAAAIKRGVPIADVETDPKVREAQLSADRIEAEFFGQVEDLTSRITKSRAILEKYSSEGI